MILKFVKVIRNVSFWGVYLWPLFWWEKSVVILMHTRWTGSSSCLRNSWLKHVDTKTFGKKMKIVFLCWNPLSHVSLKRILTTGRTKVHLYILGSENEIRSKAHKSLILTCGSGLWEETEEVIRMRIHEWVTGDHHLRLKGSRGARNCSWSSFTNRGIYSRQQIFSLLTLTTWTNHRQKRRSNRHPAIRLFVTLYWLQFRMRGNVCSKRICQ